MRYWILSDLHFEFHPDGGKEFLASLPEPDYDVLLLAGDLCDYPNLVRALSLISQRFKKTYYVVGNHECYGSWINLTITTARMAAREFKNIHLLECSRVDNVVGATLWFPYVEYEPTGCEHYMNDFDEIRNLRRDVGHQNEMARGYLGDVTGYDVVVTHHLPSEACVHKKHEHSPLNQFYVGGVEALMKRKAPKLWAHGHTHESMDHMLGGTRVVCNPFGYLGRDVNPNFEPNLVIEI